LKIYLQNWSKIRLLKPVAVRLALLAVRGYQLVLSPVLGPACRFYPSCSEYTFQAIERYGLLKGFQLGVRRLLRCHPFHPGGFDPLP
jgi:putative membrane protein insertion efficiency factor